MNNFDEELKVYRNIAMLTGEIFFCYTLADDSIRIYGGGFNTSKYGNNYAGINNVNLGMDNVQKLIRERIVAGIETGVADFYDNHFSFTDSRGEVHLYKLAGRLMYDQNNEIESVIGRLEKVVEDDDREYLHYDRESYRDMHTGVMDKESFVKKLNDKFIKYAGKTCGMLILNIDYDGKTEDVLREQLVNVIQILERIYTYDVVCGILDFNEIGVFYYGNDIEHNFISKIAELDMNEYALKGGIYYGPVNEGEVQQFMYKAWIAMLACKCDDAGKVIIYDAENEDIQGLYRMNKSEEVDAEIVERVLDVINSGENISVTIGELFKMIGTRYGIDCISIHEYDEGTGVAELAYQWHNADNVSVAEKVARKPFERINRYEWKDNNSIVIDNLQLYDGPEETFSKMKSIGVKAVMVNRLMAKNDREGWVTFERHGVAGRWNDTEKNICMTSTKFVSAYLFSMKKYFELVNKEEYNKTHDAVTGLLKKDIFVKEMKKYLENNDNKPLALVAVDFDNFTQINDKYGRDMGDVVLRKYAEELMSIEGRFIIGSRTHADNYMMLVNQYDERGNQLSAAMLDRNNRKFMEFCNEQCPEVDLIINSGVVLLPRHIDNVYTYMERAQIAKNKARQDSTIKCVFDY